MVYIYNLSIHGFLNVIAKYDNKKCMETVSICKCYPIKTISEDENNMSLFSQQYTAEC